MAIREPHSSSRITGRLSWLDFLRGLAVLWMVETHVANTFLQADLQGTGWFAGVTYLNGLVAPSFLFIAGFAQGLRWQGGGGTPVCFPRQARRLGGIALVGYALHVPFPQLWRREWELAWRLGTQVDVLQCLAVSLLVLLTLTWGAQRLPTRWRRVPWWIGVTGLLIAVMVSSRGLANWEGGMLPVRAFVNGSTGSLFPLFSWSAFVFAGALCGALWSQPVSMRLLVLFVVVGVGQTLPESDFSAMSAEFFLERLGWVIGLALLCERLVPQAADGWICFAGRESLWMYVGHLGFIFFLADTGLVPGKGLQLPATVGCLVGIVLGTYGLTWAKTHWRMMRRQPAMACEG